MFVDRAVVEVLAGAGGAGAEAFRREKGVPRGGPSGGDGGKGGDVVLVGDAQLDTLLDYSYRTRYEAERGMHGEGSEKTGRSGDDLVLRVPLGTAAYDADTDRLLGELLVDGQRLVIAEGGRGGRGNARFKSATRQAPREWEPGSAGTDRRVRLELKLIADVGLVGEPNAGKSTLLAAVTAARPKVADYPFTTLEPNLGVVQLSDFRTLVLADLPGIIEGAHQGKGLGHQFLRHVERTRVLLLMIPADSVDPRGELERIRTELAAHSDRLAAVPFLVGVSKTDLIAPGAPVPDVSVPAALGVVGFSAVSGGGLEGLLERLWKASRWVAEEHATTPEDEEWWTP